MFLRVCVSKKKNDKTDRSVCCCGTSGHGRPEELDFSPRKLSAFDVTQWPHTRRSSGVRTNRNPSDAANPKRSYFSVGLLRAPLTAWIKAHNPSIQKTDTSVGITEADEKKKKKKKTKQLINCFFFSFLFNKLKCWVTFKHLAENEITVPNRKELDFFFLMRLKVRKPHLTSYIQEHKYLMEGRGKKKIKALGRISVGFSVTSKPTEPSILWGSSPRSGGNQAALRRLSQGLWIITMGQWAGWRWPVWLSILELFDHCRRTAPRQSRRNNQCYKAINK